MDLKKRKKDALDRKYGWEISRPTHNTRTVALAGNPNVGKSTLFNQLTGMHQHTGNWSGKTVSTAKGTVKSKKNNYLLVDLPGTYSLLAHSKEEEVACRFLSFGAPDAVVVVCDATCLERNLNLALQVLEISSRVILCLNMMEDAKKKKIHIDVAGLEKELGIPVVVCDARKKKGCAPLLSALDKMTSGKPVLPPPPLDYGPAWEEAISLLEPVIAEKTEKKLPGRWLALRLLEAHRIDGAHSLLEDVDAFLEKPLREEEDVLYTWKAAKNRLRSLGKDNPDHIVSALIARAESVAHKTVRFENADYSKRDRKIDRFLTGRWGAYPSMLLLLAVIFWLTIVGANYPSALLSDFFLFLQGKLSWALTAIGAPSWLHDMLIHGVYRVVSWVVSVMLPPMAIFFPLFTILEDVGYLPRIAYNLDRPFRACTACGKQALTMCMGFGCNAAGVVGCRIIDSRRERLLAILTNNFVPCNGRFPALIALISIFFIGSVDGAGILSTLFLTLVIVVSIAFTFAATFFLSKTFFRGAPSPFALELPPYRKPRFGQILTRSLFDRTLSVLGRAVTVAAPTGLLIWIMTNLSVGGTDLLAFCADLLHPFASLMGLDGMILLAFILGFPANEIVIPIVLMGYLSAGSLTDATNLSTMKEILVANGWTWMTAVSFILFSVMHWPCSTALLTVKKETGSLRLTALAFLLPAMTGVTACLLFTAITRIFL